MTTADDYIRQVLDCLPGGTPLRSQIAMELNAHIAERMTHGHSLADVLQLLGDPRELAESYLTAVPLVSATFMSRSAAKVIDALTIGAVMAVLAWLLWLAIRPFASGDALGVVMSFGVLILVVGGSFGFAAYTIFAEVRHGRTLGKKLLGLRVVSESGMRIGFGQGLVRQLPMFLQFYYIDVLFALFTEKSQRAFEMLSKTRVVVDPARVGV